MPHGNARCRAWAFDGSVSTSLDHPAVGRPNGLVEPGPDFRDFVRTDLISDSGLYCGSETWETVLANGWLQPTGTDTVAGRACYVLEGRVGPYPEVDFPGYLTKVWIDPARGFASVKREVHDPKTGEVEPGLSYEALALGEVADGVWLPTHVLYGSGLELRVTDLVVNEPLADEQFRLRFPEGTAVNDRVLGIRYRIGAGREFLLEGETPSADPLLGEDFLDELLVDPAPPASRPVADEASPAATAGGQPIGVQDAPGQRSRWPWLVAGMVLVCALWLVRGLVRRGKVVR